MCSCQQQGSANTTPVPMMEVGFAPTLALPKRITLSLQAANAAHYSRELVITQHVMHLPQAIVKWMQRHRTHATWIVQATPVEESEPTHV